MGSHPLQQQPQDHSIVKNENKQQGVSFGPQSHVAMKAHKPSWSLRETQRYKAISHSTDDSYAQTGVTKSKGPLTLEVTTKF